MIDEQDDRTPIIRTELISLIGKNSGATDFRRIVANWSLEDAIDAFLDELSATRPVTTYSSSGSEILAEAELADRSFPSMHFDHRLLNRLASTGMSLRITTGQRTTTY